MAGSLWATRAGAASLASRLLTQGDDGRPAQPALRLLRGVEVRCGRCALAPLILRLVRRVTGTQRSRRSCRRHDVVAAAGSSSGGGARGGSGSAPRQQDDANAAPEAAAPSSFADVAAVLGLDPSELESDAGSPEDLADGVVGAGDGDVLSNSPFAPLLGAVTDEITARWRSAIAGRWSPTTAKPLGPCTPHPYLERKLRPEDAERYAAAGVLPYLSEDGLHDSLLSLSGGMELIVGGPASLAAGAPTLPGPGMRSPVGPLGNTFVLLARQGPGKRRKRYLAKLQLLGGKREGGDVGPLATALREIREETGGLLNAASVRRELLGPVLWIPEGRFALFLYGMQPHQRKVLPSAFEGRANAPEVKGEVESLEWVPLTNLLTKPRAQRQGIAPFARHVIIQPQLLRHLMQQAGKTRQSALMAQAAKEAAEQTAEADKRMKRASEAARLSAQQARQAAQTSQQARAQQQAQQQTRTEAEARQAANARLVAQARRAAADAPTRPLPVAPPAVVARSVNDVAELLKLGPAAGSSSALPLPSSSGQQTPPSHQELATPPTTPQPPRSEFGSGRTHAGGVHGYFSSCRWRPPRLRAHPRCRCSRLGSRARRCS